MKLIFPSTPHAYRARPRMVAADSLPATNVRGFSNDTENLRGKFLAECSPFHRKPRNLKPDSKRGIQNLTPGTSQLKPSTAFIDDGD